MTIDLDAIRQREQAATEGPWRAAWPKGLHPWEVCISADVGIVALAHGEQGIADAEFIAHARADVPALLAERNCLAFQLEGAQLDATAYRDLADALQATMTDPDRWDCDEAEIAIMLRYVQHLATILEAVENLTRNTDGDDLDPDAEIPVGEIQRVLHDAAATR